MPSLIFQNPIPGEELRPSEVWGPGLQLLPPLPVCSFEPYIWKALKSALILCLILSFLVWWALWESWESDGLGSKQVCTCWFCACGRPDKTPAFAPSEGLEPVGAGISYSFLCEAQYLGYLAVGFQSLARIQFFKETQEYFLKNKKHHKHIVPSVEGNPARKLQRSRVSAAGVDSLPVCRKEAPAHSCLAVAECWSRALWEPPLLWSETSPISEGRERPEKEAGNFRPVSYRFNKQGDLYIRLVGGQQGKWISAPAPHILSFTDALTGFVPCAIRELQPHITVWRLCPWAYILRAASGSRAGRQHQQSKGGGGTGPLSAGVHLIGHAGSHLLKNVPQHWGCPVSWWFEVGLCMWAWRSAGPPQTLPDHRNIKWV